MNIINNKRCEICKNVNLTMFNNFKHRNKKICSACFVKSEEKEGLTGRWSKNCLFL